MSTIKVAYGLPTTPILSKPPFSLFIATRKNLIAGLFTLGVFVFATSADAQSNIQATTATEVGDTVTNPVTGIDAVVVRLLPGKLSEDST